MSTIITVLLGVLPAALMIRRIIEKQEYEWLLVIPFYFIAFAFTLYQLDIIFPGLLAR